VLTVGGTRRWDSGIGWEAEMNGGGRQSSLGGHTGRSVVGDGGLLSAFYKAEGEQERGREVMRPTTMADL
jgi:hypothetical protein